MKTDRRTKYTKMVIKEAFLQLIKKKPIQKITISDICSIAEISRPTFYFHYEDIYALIDEIGNEMLVSANLKDITKLTLEDNDKIYEVILKLVKIIEKNEDIYRICVLERGIASKLPKLIAEELNSAVINNWITDGKLNITLDNEYFLNYLQASFNSIIYCWINCKKERKPAEEIAAVIKTFLMNGLTGFAN